MDWNTIFYLSYRQKLPMKSPILRWLTRHFNLTWGCGPHFVNGLYTQLIPVIFGISWNIPYYIWDYTVFYTNSILYGISWKIPCYIWDYMGYILNLYGISWNIPCYIRIIWVRLMDFKPRIRFVGRTSCVREANPGRRMSSSMVSSQVRRVSPHGLWSINGGLNLLIWRFSKMVVPQKRMF